MHPDIESDLIKDVILSFYHKGHEESDPDKFDQILHDQWKLFYLDEEGDLQVADKRTYLSWYDPKFADKKLQWNTNFHSIDIDGHLATVKLNIENQKFGYLVYFTLMKLDTKWWIMNKISRRL